MELLKKAVVLLNVQRWTSLLYWMDNTCKRPVRLKHFLGNPATDLDDCRPVWHIKTPPGGRHCDSPLAHLSNWASIYDYFYSRPIVPLASWSLPPGDPKQSQGADRLPLANLGLAVR